MDMMLDRAIALTLASFDTSKSPEERAELRAEALSLTRVLAPA